MLPAACTEKQNADRHDKMENLKQALIGQLSRSLYPVGPPLLNILGGDEQDIV